MSETFNKLVQCLFCSEKLEDPVILPCGETICSAHTSFFHETKNNKCKFCNNDHILKNEEKFPPNKMAIDLLASQLEKLNFGNLLNDALANLELLRSKISQYESCTEKQIDTIYDYFTSKKDQVNLAADEIFCKIQEFSENFLDKVYLYQVQCQNSHEFRSRDARVVIKNAKTKLNEWQNECKMLLIDENKCSDIFDNSKQLLFKIDNDIRDFESLCFINYNKMYEFDNRFQNTRELFMKYFFLENFFP
jgi:hypothetical protein